MASQRRQIIDAIKAALETITELNEIFIGMAPLNKTDVVSIIPRTDEFERSSKTTNRDRFNIALRYVVKEAFEQALLEYETVAPLIKAKMDADKKWGGLAYDTLLQNETWLYPDSEHPDTGIDINYVIEYAP